jgi:hypothetical protein
MMVIGIPNSKQYLTAWTALRLWCVYNYPIMAGTIKSNKPALSVLNWCEGERNDELPSGLMEMVIRIVCV